MAAPDALVEGHECRTGAIGDFSSDCLSHTTVREAEPQNGFRARTPTQRKAPRLRRYSSSGRSPDSLERIRPSTLIDRNVFDGAAYDSRCGWGVFIHDSDYQAGGSRCAARGDEITSGIGAGRLRLARKDQGQCTGFADERRQDPRCARCPRKHRLFRCNTSKLSAGI